MYCVEWRKRCKRGLKGPGGNCRGAVRQMVFTDVAGGQGAKWEWVGGDWRRQEEEARRNNGVGTGN